MVDEKEKSEKRATKTNKSLHFVAPMIGISYSFYRYNLINCYLNDKLNRPNLDIYHVFLLVKKEDDALERLRPFVEYYKVDEGYMYVFKVPDQYEEDYLKFILGKYSEFSNSYKKRIITLLPTPYTKSNVFKVISKSEEAKEQIEKLVGETIGDQEVMSVPNWEDECYE